MQVQYRETKSGFECIHLPSIDVSSVDSPTSPNQYRNQQSPGEPPLTPTHRTGTRPKVTKKVSKLSFGFHREKGKDRDREPSIESGTGTIKEKELPGRPSGTTTLTATPSSGSSSFFNVSSQHTAVPEVTLNGTTPSSPVTASGNPDATTSVEIDVTPPSRSQSPSSVKGKMLPPIPRDFAMMPRATSPGPLSPVPLTGEVVNREMFETMGRNTLSVRFEINIVKVPWLPFHGIQFRRAGGDGWQYQMLARRVLTELKL